MLLWPAVDELERITHLRGQSRLVVSLHGQPTAIFRPIHSEGGDNDQPALGPSARQRSSVRLALLAFGKEVKDCSVVPHVKPSRRAPGGDVGHFPSNSFGHGTKAHFCRLESRRGNIQHCDIQPPYVQQRIYEGGCSASNIDQRRGWQRPATMKGPQRGSGIFWYQLTASGALAS